MKRSYRLGLYEKSMPDTLSMEEKLQTAKQFGYDFLEMSIDETPEKLARLEMPVAERTALLNTMRQAGLPIRTICLSGHRKYPMGSMDDKVRARSMEIMEQAIRLACDLGVRVIQIAGYDVYYEESTANTKARFLESLRYSVEVAAAHGVILAFETMETSFMNNVKKAMVYVREVNSPYLQVYPDTGNCMNAAVAYREDVIQDMCSGNGHIVAMHLKETVPGKFRDIAYGAGHVDFTQLIKAALQQGVRLFVTEFWDTPYTPYLEHIQFSKAFIDQKILETYG